MRLSKDLLKDGTLLLIYSLGGDFQGLYELYGESRNIVEGFGGCGHLSSCEIAGCETISLFKVTVLCFCYNQARLTVQDRTRNNGTTTRRELQEKEATIKADTNLVQG